MTETTPIEPFVGSWDHIYQWMNLAPGEFSVKDIDRDPVAQSLLTERFEKLVSAGVCDRVGKRRGWYRLRETEIEPMNLIDADDTPVKIWLPFRISDYVQLFPGNIIVFAGAKSSGKTALALNVVKENDHQWDLSQGWDVHYFNSEMGAGELKLRLKLFPERTLDMWTFKAYERSGNFADVIKSGEGVLNIIDFLEVHDEFYLMGKWIKEIHDRLDGAVAIICIQKNPGVDVGMGGWRSMEKTRLALALEYGRCKITEAKNWVDPTKNPNGWETTFKLRGGCQITQGPAGWLRKEEA